MKRIYLDANGSCPALSSAQDKIIELLPRLGNPSSFHEQGRFLRAVLDDARDQVAKALGARAKEIIFCSGASEANRLFADALGLKSRELRRPLKVTMSPFEHPSLYKPLLALAEEGFIKLNILPLNADGYCLANDELKKSDVVIICQAHNETGILPNLSELLTLVSEQALVMSDVSQSLSRVGEPLARIDVLTCSAQKLGGLAGAGALVLRNNALSLKAPWAGGGQEKGFRPGTESALLLAAFGEACAQIKEERLANQNLKQIRDHLEKALKKEQRVLILGEKLERLPNTLAACFLGEDPDFLRIACDMAGLSLGFGAACSGLAPEGSFALKRLGLTKEQEKTCIRFSLYREINLADINEALSRLNKIFKF